MVSENQKNFKLNARPNASGQSFTSGSQVFTGSNGKWLVSNETIVYQDYRTNLTSCYDASNGPTPVIEGSTLTSWSDIGSDLNHLTTVGGSPQYFNNIQNSMPACYFNGAQYLYGTSKGDASQPYTMYLVMRPTNWGTGDYQIPVRTHAGTNSGNYGIYKRTGTAQVGISAGTQLNGDSLTNNQTVLITGVFNGATSSVRKNNNLPTTGAVGANANVRYPVIGTSEYVFTGYIMEWRVYQGLLTSPQDAQVQGHLNKKWGIY